MRHDTQHQRHQNSLPFGHRRAKVAGGQDHEVKYEAGKTGASKAEVKDAVKSEGNSRKRVEDKLVKK